MDPLAPLLAQFRFRSDLYCLLEGRGPWGLGIPAASDTAYVHCLRSGGGTVRIGDEAVRLEAGDIVLLPHGDAHEVLAEPGGEAVPLEIPELVARRRRRGDRRYVLGRGRVRTEMICGGYSFDDNGFNPVLDFLPPLVYLPAAANAEPRMSAILAAAAHELANPGLGSDLALERLAELLLIAALRSCIGALGGERGDHSWLAGLGDPPTAAALHAIHAEPERAWTLTRLAERAAVSTSTLTARFRAHIGMSPRQYLTRWRMLKATSLLSDTASPLGEIAAQVGYGSEAAFSKAFRGEFGIPPGEFRRARVRSGD